MASYLVETYAPIEGQGLPKAVAGIRAIAAAMSRQGVPVRHLTAILVPGDETCFHLVDAPSLEAVDELTRRARLACTRIVEAIE
jgi:hypothetical protein